MMLQGCIQFVTGHDQTARIAETGELTNQELIFRTIAAWVWLQKLRDRFHSCHAEIQMSIDLRQWEPLSTGQLTVTKLSINLLTLLLHIASNVYSVANKIHMCWAMGGVGGNLSCLLEALVGCHIVLSIILARPYKHRSSIAKAGLKYSILGLTISQLPKMLDCGDLALH